MILPYYICSMSDKNQEKKTQDMKKTNKLEVLPNQPSSWSDSLEEHPFIQWTVANGKLLTYTLIGLVAAILLIFRFASMSESSSEARFIQAEKEYLLFAAPLKEGHDENAQKNAFNRLNSILDAHPELHAKYDGLIAEILLIRGDVSQAKGYASSAIQRTEKENAPFYSNYAQTTFMIANGQYEQALKEAQALKDQMIQQGQQLENTPEKMQFSTLLYGFNLLRIGMLQQQLGLTEELQTWQEWKDLTRKSQEGSLPNYLDAQLFLSFNHLLSEGNIPFANYIEAREKVLKKL